MNIDTLRDIIHKHFIVSPGERTSLEQWLIIYHERKFSIKDAIAHAGCYLKPELPTSETEILACMAKIESRYR